MYYKSELSILERNLKKRGFPGVISEPPPGGSILEEFGQRFLEEKPT